MKLILLSFCILLLAKSTVSAYPKLPVKFTQAYWFVETDTQLNTTGKCWYDSSTYSIKFALNGPAPICRYIYPETTDCTFLIINTTGYTYLPSKNLCCVKSTDLPIDRDFLDFLAYKGEKSINDTAYDYWYYSGGGPFPPLQYWTVKNQTRIPRRFELGVGDAYQMIDFWENTYSEQFDSKAVFTIPPGCDKPCPKSQDQKLQEKTNIWLNSMGKFIRKFANLKSN